MQTIIKPSAAIRQNYNEIANRGKETQEPVFLTKNEGGDLAVMDIAVYDQRKKQTYRGKRCIKLIFPRLRDRPWICMLDIVPETMEQNVYYAFWMLMMRKYLI